MQKVEIKKLKEELEKRNDDNASEEFLKVFGKFVGSYLEYKKWIIKMVKKNGDYHGHLNSEERAIKDIKLVEDILKNGITTPIERFEDKHGTEIDGYHRLIISEKLGKKYVPISDGTSCRTLKKYAPELLKKKDE